MQKNQVIIDGVDIADKVSSIQMKIEPDRAVVWMELCPDEIEIEADINELLQKKGNS